MLCGVAAAQQPLGELYATDASVKGAVILAGSGTSVLSGSSIEAGAQIATLKLERGGALRVCAGTGLSITSSANGRSLLFSLNSGSLEMNYPMGSSADTLLTPDLRLLLPGPGTVHVAVQVTPKGDTCVQSLPTNSAAIVVSETMSDATYQLKPDQSVLFPAGHISSVTSSHQNCGCPAPPPVQVAKAAPPPATPAPVESKPATTAQAPPPVALPATAAGDAKPLALSEPPPPVSPTGQHLVMQVPFVFSAEDPDLDVAPLIATLKLEHNQVPQFDPVVLPPSPQKKSAAAKQTSVANNAAKHGFFSRIGSFFASLWP
jgi:hypothetical protein